MQKTDALVGAFGFLREMGEEGRERLLAQARRLSAPGGKDLLHPGDVVSGVYLVTSGAIRVYYVDPNGREGTLYWIEPGQSCILALNSLFSEMPYPAWAAAEEQGAELLLAPGEAFRDLFSRERSVQKFLFEQLSKRVYGLMQTLEGSMRLSQEQRLALLLLDLAGEDGVVRLSQEKIARHLGTIREVVSRLLRNLASQGLIALAPRRATILDRRRLEEIAGDD